MDQRDPSAQPPTDKELVDLLLERTEDLSLQEAARVTGLSFGTIARFRRGEWKRLYPSTRREIVQFLQSTPADLVEERAGVEEPEAFFASLDEVMRTLQKIDPGPGAQRARKKDALRLIRELAATLGEPLPEWFWDIQERVERGEL